MQRLSGIDSSAETRRGRRVAAELTTRSLKRQVTEESTV